MSIEFGPANFSYENYLKNRNIASKSNNSNLKAQKPLMYRPDGTYEQKKTQPVQKFKNFIAGMKKAWIYLAEYGKGILGGTLVGGVLAGITYTGFAVKNTIRQGFKKAKPKTFGKIASVGIGLASLGVSLFKASLNVSERTANVDHRYNTGHRFE